MPLLCVPSFGDGIEGVQLFYEVHGAQLDESVPKLCMLMGFGATGIVWAPQLADLLAAQDEVGEAAMAVCILDNRGVGRSSSPAGWKNYTTQIMARDTLALMDHLGWEHFHLVGHSMGTMIACKLAAAAPKRVQSLSLISGTAGRWQALPQSATALWLTLKSLFARSARGKAEVMVQFHYSPSLLEEVDPVTKKLRRKTVIGEYVEAYLEEEAAQSGDGAWGQLGAVLRHRLRKHDVKSIQLGQFPIQVIHGRQDVVALPKYGEKLAQRLQAPCIMLEGGHMVIREQAAAINALLRSIMMDPQSWTNVERYPYMPFRHWVSVVERHRERSAALAAQRAPKAGGEAQPAEQGAGRRLSWPLRLWRGESLEGDRQLQMSGGKEDDRQAQLDQQQPQPQGPGGGRRDLGAPLAAGHGPVLAAAPPLANIAGVPLEGLGSCVVPVAAASCSSGDNKIVAAPASGGGAALLRGGLPDLAGRTLSSSRQSRAGDVSGSIEDSSSEASKPLLLTEADKPAA